MTLKALLQNGALVVGSVLLTIFLLEAGLHLSGHDERYMTLDWFDQFEGDASIGYDLRINLPERNVYVGADWHLYQIWTNELGCFDRQYDGKPYVLLVGDSFTHAHGSFESKWGTVLENRTNFRVLKCGVSGYGTRQELLKARKVLGEVDEDPDLIIVGYFANDLIDDHLFPNAIVRDHHLITPIKSWSYETGKVIRYESESEIDEVVSKWEKYCTPDPLSNYYTAAIKCWFNKKSVLWHLTKSAVKTVIRSANANVRPPTSIVIPRIQHGEDLCTDCGWPAEAWKDHASNIAEFRDFADGVGARLLFVLIPTRALVYPFLFPDSEVRRQVTSYYDRIRQILLEQGIDYLDLELELRAFSDQTPRPFLSSDEDFYWKLDEHFSNVGNQIVGLLVSRYVLENKLINVPNIDQRLAAIRQELLSYGNHRN